MHITNSESNDYGQETKSLQPGWNFNCVDNGKQKA